MNGCMRLRHGFRKVRIVCHAGVSHLLNEYFKVVVFNWIYDSVNSLSLVMFLATLGYRTLESLIYGFFDE